MVSETRKIIEITRLQGSSVNFNELPYITLKASPKIVFNKRLLVFSLDDFRGIKNAFSV